MQTYSKGEVVAKGAFAATLGAHVTICGLWAWAEFQGKPAPEIRDQLKAEGFRWAKHKGKWYFAGKPAGNREAMSWGYITEKYGEEEVMA